MALYTTLDESDVSAIARVFDLDCTSWSPMSGGANNTNYVMAGTTGKFVVTVLEEGDGASQRRLAQLLVHIEDSGIRTGKPRHSAEGSLVELVNGHPVMVKEFVEGACHLKMPWSSLAPAGETLAKVHAIEPPAWLPNGARRPSEPLASLDSVEDRVLARWAMSQIEARSSALDLDAPTGLIHGDYFPDNVVIQANGEVAVLDWVTASNDLLLLDLGFALVGMSRADYAFVPQRANEFMRGYTSLRQLTAQEQSRIRDVVLYASAVLALHRYSLAQQHEAHRSVVPRHERMMTFAETVPTDWSPYALD